MTAQGMRDEYAAHLHAVAVVAMAQVADDGRRYAEDAAYLLDTKLRRRDPFGVFQRHGDFLVLHAVLKNRGLASVGGSAELLTPRLAQPLQCRIGHHMRGLKHARQARPV